MIKFQDATRTRSGLMLYMRSDRKFWIATDIKTGMIHGLFDGAWFA